MLLKRMLILTIVLGLMLSIGSPVVAANENPMERIENVKTIIAPMSVLIDSTYTNLSVSPSGTATAYGYNWNVWAGRSSFDLSLSRKIYQRLLDDHCQLVSKLQFIFWVISENSQRSIWL